MDRLVARRPAEVSAGRTARDGAGHRRCAIGRRAPGGRGVLEIVEAFEGDAHRAVYTVRFAEAVYVLHAFQKKSKRGIATPRHEIELIKDRLKRAEEHHRTHYPKGA